MAWYKARSKSVHTLNGLINHSISSSFSISPGKQSKLRQSTRRNLAKALTGTHFISTSAPSGGSYRPSVNQTLADLSEFGPLRGIDRDKLSCTDLTVGIKEDSLYVSIISTLFKIDLA